ncbi:MAG: hypothetical protein J6Z11_01570 [Candidatus Riflebacteria bacterium]|nr:hypothetical protein [Candidatus Riflebacteria bacterium]
MKYIKYFIILAVVFLIYNRCSADNSRYGNKKVLSNNEIDLLVGTPEGISEPLDVRRNKITKDNQVDYSSFLDENALSDNENLNFNWEDAEDSTPNENQVETQLMDLLAETEELEKIDEIFYHDDEDENASETENITLSNYEYKN